MTNAEFRAEMHAYLDRQYDRFENVQKGSAEAFQAFHQVCRKHEIPYFMLYGTLMGLVRDGGFIPWDSDMDVAIPIDQLPRLKAALKADLPEGFYVVSEEDEDFDYFQIRICKKGIHHDVLHLDVFYLIGAPEGEQLEAFKTEAVGLFRKRIVYQYYLGLKKRTDLGRMEKLTRFYYGLTVGRLTIPKLNAQMEELTHRYSYGQAKKLVCLAEERNAVDKSLIEPAKLVQTSMGEASFPHDEIGYLNAIYKDYKSYPAIEHRFRECYTYLAATDELAQKPADYYVEK